MNQTVDEPLRHAYIREPMADASTPMQPRVFVVEDDVIAATYVVKVLRSAGLVAEHYSSAEAFLDHVDPAHRGCVVLDLHMDGMTGLQLQTEMVNRSIFLPVIIVTGEGKVASAVTAMKQDAFDFFEKPVDPERLLSTVRRAIEHDAQQAVTRADAQLIQQRYRVLSPRERQVMGLVVQGLANKQIAANLDLSEKTIEVHRGNVMRKMQVESVAALVRASIICESIKF